MKVMVLADRLDIAGGLERSLANKVKAWCDEGRDVHVVTISQEGGDYYCIDARVTRSNIGVYYNGQISLLTFANIRHAVRHFIALRKLYREIRPTHIVHCGYGFDFYFLPFISRRSFLIKENHSSRYKPENLRGLFNRLKERIRYWFDSSFDASVFLNNEEARLSGLRNTVVIPNALAERRVLDRDCRKQVISAGRICAVKGFDRLVEAWALAAPQLPNWHLTIYGDGATADVLELHKKISYLGLSERVSVRASTIEIIERMAESSIYAMASRSECFPMVLLEAMQVGLPIVAYDCPTGPRNIIASGDTGFLVADGDAKGFADALVRLAQHPDLAVAIGSKARHAALRYTSGDIATMWSVLFARGN